MPVYGNPVVQNPLVRFDSHDGGIQIACGFLVLDMRDFQSQSSPGDWLRDDILWAITIDTTKWKKPASAAMIAFPMTADIKVDAGTHLVGWGIDSCGLEREAGLSDADLLYRKDRVNLTAKLVLKSPTSEILRVGYQLSLSA